MHQCSASKVLVHIILCSPVSYLHACITKTLTLTSVFQLPVLVFDVKLHMVNITVTSGD